MWNRPGWYANDHEKHTHPAVRPGRCGFRLVLAGGYLLPRAAKRIETAVSQNAAKPLDAPITQIRTGYSLRELSNGSTTTFFKGFSSPRSPMCPTPSKRPAVYLEKLKRTILR